MSRRAPLARHVEILRFLVAGGVAAAVNLVSRWVLNQFVSFSTAIFLAYLLGMLTAFLLTRTFVFERSSLKTQHELMRFTLVNIAGLLQVWGISMLLGEVVFPRYGMNDHAQDIAHLVGVIVPVFSSYLGHKHFSFARHKDGPKLSDQPDKHSALPPKFNPGGWFSGWSQESVREVSGFLSSFMTLLVVLVPWRPNMPFSGLDPSWVSGIEWALLNGRHFGSDIVFTYGPLGFLFTAQFHPDLFVFLILFWVFFAFTLALFLARYFRTSSIMIPGLLLLPLVLTCTAGEIFHFEADEIAYGFRDHFFLILPLCVALGVLDTDHRQRPFVIAAFLLIAALGGLGKFTALMAAAVAFLLLDIQRFAKDLRLPFFLPVYLALCWLLFRLVDGDWNFPLWVFRSAEVARGYSAAMALEGPTLQILAIGGLGFSALLLLYYNLLMRGRRLSASGSSGILLIAAISLFLILKAGLVRHDLGHIMISVKGILLLFILAVLSGYSGRLKSPNPFTGLILTLGAMVVLLFSAWIPLNSYQFLHKPLSPTVSPLELAKEWLFIKPQEQLNAMKLTLVGERFSVLMARRVKALAAIREKVPFPELTGTVDIYPFDLSVVLARGFDYRPRPVFQSYSAYTPKLLELNDQFLAGPNGPKTVIFAIKSIDERLPALDDGVSWKSLLKLYQPAESLGDFAVFKRRDDDSVVILETELLERDIAFGETLKFESSAPCVWAEVSIPENTAGKLLTALYKQARVDIELGLSFGDVRYTRRFIPGIGETGFLLSPLVMRADELRGACQGPAALDKKIYSLRFLTSDAGRLGFEKTIHVRLTGLAVGPGKPD